MNKKDNEKESQLIELIKKKIINQNIYVKNKIINYSNPTINIIEFSKAINKNPSSITAYFWQKGIEITKNQNLSEELLKDYCESIGLKIQKNIVSFNSVIDEYLTELNKNNKNKQQQERPAVIAFMGHVDHGKTTLVDTICHTDIQQKEIGGITQKVNISQIEFQQKKIFLLDSPGHKDFIRLRRRGISLTDIVILVIDSQDGIMEQTNEIINYLHQYRLTCIVFVNHKKKDQQENQKNLIKVLTQLQEKELTALEWGGQTIVLSGSAKNKFDTDRLLENVLLLADYQTNLDEPGNAIVINSYLHPQLKNFVTQALVQGGQIKEKDYIFVNNKIGQIKGLRDILNKKIIKALPGELIIIIGFNFVLELGEKMIVISEQCADELKKLQQKTNCGSSLEKRLISKPTNYQKNNINLFLVADSENSLQAITELIKEKTSNNVSLSIIYCTIGTLTSSELELVRLTQSTVLAFNCSFDQNIIKTFKENNTIFYTSRIIYELEEIIKNIINNYQKKITVEKILGTAIIKVVFAFSKNNIAGCQVIDGIISVRHRIQIWRNNKKIYTGRIKGLQVEKIDTKEVKTGQDCGITLDKFDDFHINDKIISFKLIEEIINDDF